MIRRMAALAVLALALLPIASLAQVPPIAGNTEQTTGEGDTADALQALRTAGNTVIVVPSEAPAPEPTTIEPDRSIDERVAIVRQEVAEIIATARDLPGGIAAAVVAAGGGSAAWLLPAALITLITVVVAGVAWQLTRKAVLRARTAIDNASINTRAGKIETVLAILLSHGIGAGIFFAVGYLTVLLIRPSLSPERVTAMMAVGGIAVFLAIRGLLIAVLLPNPREARLIQINETLARWLYAQLILTSALAISVAYICFWMANFPLTLSSHQFLLLLAPTISGLLFLVIALTQRSQLTRIILGDAARPTLPRRLAGRFWPWVLVAYMVIAWGLTVEGIVVEHRLALGPIMAPFLALTAMLVMAGFLLIVIDRHMARTVQNPAWTELLERTAIGLSAIFAAAVLAGLWRLYVGPYREAALLVLGYLLLVLFAWATWQAVRLFVEIRLAEENAGGDADQGDGEGFGPGGTRGATLLPILRNLAYFLIAAVVLMVTLSSLGVNVAPLFAGAGVVGLAIGFGAQALIRDLFSGAFFLLDDAFRRGEYVEVAGVAGMVEKISPRSFQLRHHRGALHTIPFGEIKQLTNFSRDWVVMKLPIRLTYNTDPEKVRKLIKKLGQDMAANPEYGHLFIEPPKSQGVIEMDDSAMIARIKFKTKPGDQFVLRRHVYQNVRELFEREGIEFAHREVTVRVTGTSDPEERRRAALGAAEAVTLDAEARGADIAAQ